MRQPQYDDCLVDLKIQLMPKQALALEVHKKASCLLYGGAKGGGKSGIQRRIQLIYATTTPGYVGVIFRRHYKDLASNHIIKFQSEYPELDKFYIKGSKEYYFPPPLNSRIMFRSLGDEKDLNKYKGVEFHGLSIDEVDEFEPDWIIRLRTCNRSSDKSIRPWTLLSGNPGGVSHHYLKRIFIDRKFTDNEKPEDYAFVQALLSDNTIMAESDPNYRDRLSAERNLQIRRAWLEGAWDIEMGQFFSDWNPQVHVIEPIDPIEGMRGWYKYGAMDWGWAHDMSFGWWAINPETQQNVLYREFYCRKMNPEQVTKALFKYPDTNEQKYVAAGHDCWISMRDGGTCVADQFHVSRPFRLNLIEIPRDRKQGWAQVRAGLQYTDFPESWGPEQIASTPRILITSNCRLTIEAIPRMQHDKTDFEDCAKIDVRDESPMGSGDDGIDMVRHAAMSRPPFNKYVPLKKSLYGRAGIPDKVRLRHRGRNGWNTI